MQTLAYGVDACLMSWNWWGWHKGGRRCKRCGWGSCRQIRISWWSRRDMVWGWQCVVMMAALEGGSHDEEADGAAEKMGVSGRRHGNGRETIQWKFKVETSNLMKWMQSQVWRRLRHSKSQKSGYWISTLNFSFDGHSHSLTSKHFFFIWIILSKTSIDDYY